MRAICVSNAPSPSSTCNPRPEEAGLSSCPDQGSLEPAQYGTWEGGEGAGVGQKYALAWECSPPSKAFSPPSLREMKAGVAGVCTWAQSPDGLESRASSGHVQLCDLG